MFYPSWRYHPKKPATIVTSAENERIICGNDKNWSDTPYNEEHVGKPPAKHEKAVVEEEEVDEPIEEIVDEKRPIGPQRHEFKTVKEYKAALKAYDAGK